MIKASLMLNTSMFSMVLLSPVKNKDGEVIDFEYTEANEKATELLGRTEKELIGKTLMQLFPATRETGILEIYKTVLENGRKHSHEFFYGHDGMNRWYVQETIPYGDKLAIITTDMSDHKRREEEARAIEAMFKTAQRLTNTGTYTWEKDKGIAWSENLYRLFGFEPYEIEITGDLYLSMVHPEDKEYYVSLLTDLMSKPGLRKFRHRVLKRDGSTGLVSGEVESFINQDGEIYKVVGFTCDVTGQWEVEESSKYHLLLKDAILEALDELGIGINITDGERIVLANKGLTKINGYSTEELLAMPSYMKIIHPSKAEEATDRILTRMRGNKPSSFIETRVIHKKGHTVDVISAIQEINALGKKLVLALSMDITEIRKQAQKLEIKNRELEQFAYIISHDLQEPLRKIITYSDRVTVKKEIDENVIRVISASAQRMYNQINDLLDFTKLSRPDIAFEKLALEPICAELSEMLNYLVEKKNAAVSIGSLPEIKGNKAQIQQLFQNLFSNSLKYARPDTQPHITVKGCVLTGEEVQSRFRINPPGNMVWVSVADNGIGFDNQYRDKVFQVFQRLHPQNEYPGTGVGLAICKKIMENHGGNISISSEPGKGTQVDMLFPSR